MQRLWTFLLDARTLTVIGVAALAGLLLLGADAMRVGAVWALGVLALLALCWAGYWLWRRWQSRKAGTALENAMQADADKALRQASKERKDEVAAVRQRMTEAVNLIKSSRLGERSGSAALYELPWYAVIGNPAAGKSSAVVMSGLKFPFSENTEQVVQGIGGTRHCDWFFTTEGILLDTAGRYAVHEEDRSEWLGFLALLKKHRPKAPLNGVIIAVSIAELIGQKPEFAIGLARKLRQRVQELTEQLAVFVPVYVVFTKADLISGFVEFFEDRDRAERDKVWGATLPYDISVKGDVVEQFDQRFDELFEGLKAASVARMALHRGEQLPPGVLTFPLEFAALKSTLRTFLNTLFEDNPYQFRPIFRGFYFTSAVQEGQSTGRASERVAAQFGLQLQQGSTAAVYSQSGFFLRDLFTKVIFADQHLVQQYTSRRQLHLRYATFFASVLLLGALLAGWTWSWMGNRAFVAHVQEDIGKAQQVQGRDNSLASRLEALEILQDRLEQVQRFRTSHSWSIGLGLYQGDAVEARLKEEYFFGLQNVMLRPTAEAIAIYLQDVNAHAGDLKPIQRVADGATDVAVPVQVAASTVADAASAVTNTAADADSAKTPYAKTSSTDVTEAYNALKAYLMLGDRDRLEPGHMSDQLTRFWRVWLEQNRGNMSREQLIGRAERLMSFALSQMHDPLFPQQDLNLTLLDQTRDNLRRVIKGMPARERVYAEIKARAATRFAPVTVARLLDDGDRQIMAGGQAVSGAFTREAWEQYVKDAIKQAANSEQHSSDWVLKTSSADDLTLEGSPEQVQKVLTQLYKEDYVKAWQKFVQSISVQDFGRFDQAVASLNRLGDQANSPMGTVFKTIYEQTAWDNPSVLNDRLAKGKSSFVEWFKQRILGMQPTDFKVDVDISLGKQGEIPMGPIGREFSGLSRLMGASSEGGASPMKLYLQGLSKLRSRFNQMKTQGDAGPASRQLMAQTLDGQGELADTLKLVDEQMMTGLSERQRATFRPILVRPLMQAFAVIVKPTEAELNRVWTAQVYEPYQRDLSDKYPFNRQAKVEAMPAEMAKIFGAEGAVSKFVEQSLSTLVTKRGDGVTPRTWADMGVHLRPDFVAGLGGWTAPLAGQAPGQVTGASNSGGQQAEVQTVFELLPKPSAGLTEFTIEVDGQIMRYRNGVASWSHFVWPGQGSPGARVSAVDSAGRQIVLFNESGRFGLQKLIESAERRKVDGGVFELKWTQGNVSVLANLKIISNAAPQPATPASVPSSSTKGATPGVLPSVIAGEEVAP